MVAAWRVYTDHCIMVHRRTCFNALKKDNITLANYAPGSFRHKDKVMVDQISINRDCAIEGRATIRS